MSVAKSCPVRTVDTPIRINATCADAQGATGELFVKDQLTVRILK